MQSFHQENSGFNPRLPLLGGDAQNAPTVSSQNVRFNPRLPLLGGDAYFGSLQTAHFMEFQSTPPVAGRRCSAATVQVTSSKSFNPRLPLLGGDAADGQRDTAARTVSIHASRCWEAMRQHPLCACAFGWFQSTPPVAGRRCQSLITQGLEKFEFQSTPPVAGRRCAFYALAPALR